MSPSLLLTGATGTVGTALLRELSVRGVSARVLVRNLQAATALQSPLVSLMEGDLRTPSTLDAALDGIERVFLLSPPGPDQVILQGNVVEAVQRTGRPIHIVKVSVLGAGPEASVPLARWHAVTEAQIRQLDGPATILRPHIFMQNLLGTAARIQADGLLFGAFGDVPLPFIDARDVAAVAAVVLTQAGHAGQTYTLTGPRLLTYAQVAATLSSLYRRPIHYVNLPSERYHEALVGDGVPNWLADNLAALARWLQNGTASTITPTVIELTGRPGRTLEQFLRDYRASFLDRTSISHSLCVEVDNAQPTPPPRPSTYRER